MQLSKSWQIWNIPKTDILGFKIPKTNAKVVNTDVTHPTYKLWLLLTPVACPEMEDLWERDHFFSNPANIESFRRWRASFGDIRELMSAADATTPLFWAAERASKSSMRVSILYMATSLTNFQMHVRMTNIAPITMHRASMIWMPRLLSCSVIVGGWRLRNEVAAGNGRKRVRRLLAHNGSGGVLFFTFCVILKSIKKRPPRLQI